MKTSRFGLALSLAAALLGSASPAAFAQPSYASVGYAGTWSPPAAEAGIGDKIKDAVKGGLIHMAVVFANTGAAIVTNRMIQAGTAPKNIGWGTGTTAAAVTDTALVTEAAPTTSGGRTVGTESRTTITVTNDNYQVAGTVTAAGTLAITEAGLFDAVTAGNLLTRGVFTAVNVVSGDSIAFTFGLKFVPG